MSSAPEYHPPSAPDPHMVARAQGQQERQTARANNLFMNPSVQTPFGRIKYDTNEEDIEGEKFKRPEQIIELSPQEQEAYERSGAIRRHLGEAGIPLGQYLRKGVEELGSLPHMRPNLEGIDRVPSEDEYRNDRRRYEEAYYNRAAELMRPDLEQSENRLRSRLAAMGHPVGNEAYNNELSRFERSRDANLRALGNEAILSGGQEQRNMFGIGQAIRGEQLAQALRPYEFNQMERRNRMGENQFNLAALSALLSGQQVQMPQLQQFNTAAMRAPDIQGLYASNYAQQSQNYNNQFQNEMANHMSNMQGLYGLGGAGLSGLMGAAGRAGGFSKLFG